jgi:hypothetical protein
MTIETIMFAENAAFAIQRSLPQYDVRREDLLSFARRLISEAIDDEPDQEELDEAGWENHNRRKFDSAARVLSSLASQSANDEPARRHLLVLSAIAFCLDGNQVSGLLIGRALLTLPDLSESLVVTLGVGCPLLASDCLRRENLQALATEILQRAHAAIALPKRSAHEIVRLLVQFESARREPGLGSSLNLALRGLQSAEKLRFDSILASQPFPLRDALIKCLRENDRNLALPSQSAALGTPGLLGTSRPALVSLPTGAGKTLVGLITLASCLNEPDDIVVFLAPYLAIRRQVRDQATRLCGNAVTVASGSLPIRDIDGPTIIVDTPEAFDAKLRRNTTIRRRLRAIVLDEAHLLGSEARGMLADGLLTRLSLNLGATRETKVVLLSAVLDESEPVAQWLQQFGEPVQVRSRWRPAARRIGVWRGDGTLQWIRTLGSLTGRPNIQRVGSSRIEPVYPHLAFGHPKAASGPRFEQCDANVALLATALWNADQEKTLVVVGTRTRARLLARTIASRLEMREREYQYCELIKASIDRSHPEFADLKPLLDKGVAYHSAAIPVDLRTKLEIACSSGELWFVCATTSLAEGADLPFGRVLLADWTFPVGDGTHQPFPPSLWRNIAGRSGRPSSHIEGETIIVEEIPVVAFRSPGDRRSALWRMLIGKVVLESSLDAPLTRRRAVDEQLVSQAIAAIEENPAREEVHTELVNRLLAARTSDTDVVTDASAMVERRLLHGDDPIATRESPIRLTDRGRAMLVSPVLPDATDALMTLARSRKQAFRTPGQLCEALLFASAECADLSHTAMARLANGKTVKGLWIRRDELASVCDEWLQTASVRNLLTIQAERQNRITKASRADLATWLNGEKSSDRWVTFDDKLSDFCRSVLSEYLPRALSAVTLGHSTEELSARWSIDIESVRATADRRAQGMRDPDDLV